MRRANEILKSASEFSCEGDRPGPNEASAYVDQHRDRFGVAPVCRTLGVSASAYYHRAAGVRSARVVEDERLLAVIRQTHEANYLAYGYRRMESARARRRARAALPSPATDGRARDPGREASREAVADHQTRPGGGQGT
jgi:hypothetical protein